MGPSKCPPLHTHKNHQCLCGLMTCRKTGNCSPTTWERCCHPHDLLLLAWFVLPTYTGSAADEGRGLSAQEASPQLLPFTGPTQTPAMHSQQLPSAALPNCIFKTTGRVSDLKLQMAENRCTDLKRYPKHFKKTFKNPTRKWIKRSNKQQRLQL